MGLKCRWCFRPLNQCIEGEWADATRLPAVVLRAWRLLGPGAKRLESWWVMHVGRRRAPRRR